MKDNKERFM